VLQCVAVRCSVLHCVALCCSVYDFELIRHKCIILNSLCRNSSVLQCIAVCCSALQCVAGCCSVLQCVAVYCGVLHGVTVCCSVRQCVAECCNAYSVLRCVAWCCSVLQCVSVCCGMLQCIAVCGSVWRNRKVSLPHNRCAPRTNASSLVHNRSTKDIPWKHCATDEIEYILCHTTGASLEQTRVGAYTTNLQKIFLGNTVQQMKKNTFCAALRMRV